MYPPETDFPLAWQFDRLIVKDESRRSRCAIGCPHLGGHGVQMANQKSCSQITSSPMSIRCLRVTDHNLRLADRFQETFDGFLGQRWMWRVDHNCLTGCGWPTRASSSRKKSSRGCPIPASFAGLGFSSHDRIARVPSTPKSHPSTPPRAGSGQNWPGRGTRPRRSLASHGARTPAHTNYLPPKRKTTPLLNRKLFLPIVHRVRKCCHEVLGLHRTNRDEPGYLEVQTAARRHREVVLRSRMPNSRA